jgi:DNA topoisomerase-1
MSAFGRVLPALRRRLNRDLARPGLPRDKVLATVVKLLETTFIRIGNEEYARHNRSFGLTTMRSKHVKVQERKSGLNFVARVARHLVSTLTIAALRKSSIIARICPDRSFFGISTRKGNTEQLIRVM